MACDKGRGIVVGPYTDNMNEYVCYICNVGPTGKVYLTDWHKQSIPPPLFSSITDRCGCAEGGEVV